MILSSTNRTTMPSKLEQLQLQFRQRLMQEKEERMIKIHTDNQQKALNKVMKYESPPAPVVSRKPPSMNSNPAHQSPTKKSSPGVDRSRPLPPISKEPKAHTATGRYNGMSSESSLKIPFQNGIRSRSMDADSIDLNYSKANGKSKLRTDFNHVNDNVKSSSNHVGRRSPSEKENVKKRETELIRAKALAKAQANNFHETNRMNGFHPPSTIVKSSTNESRTITGNIKPQTSNTVNVKAKPKTKVSTFSSKVFSAPSKAQNNGKQPVMRKPPNPNQKQCHVCGRNFNADRIDKHETICSKTAKKKTKVFDATKMRVQGTEAETFVKKGLPSAPPKSKKADWKKQHEEFINTIRQAKVAQRHLAAGGKLSDLPPPPPSDTSDYVPCPYCGRKFNEGVAERHIPKCKNIVSNKKNPTKRK